MKNGQVLAIQKSYLELNQVETIFFQEICATDLNISTHKQVQKVSTCPQNTLLKWAQL